jgi:hypothetical protein
MEKLWKIHGKPWKIPSYQPKKEVYGQIHRKNHMANPSEKPYGKSSRMQHFPHRLGPGCFSSFVGSITATVNALRSIQATK